MTTTNQPNPVVVESAGDFARLASEAFLDDDHLIDRDAAVLFLARRLAERDAAIAQEAERRALIAVADWLDTDPAFQYAARHIRCNANDPGGPGDGSCLPLRAKAESAPAKTEGE